MNKSLKWAIALVVLLCVFTAMILISRGVARAQIAARELRWAEEAVLSGRKSPDVNIYVQHAIPLLAMDEACRESVESLNFSYMQNELDPSFDFSSIRRLKKLRYMYFYCSDSDPILRAAAGMESIEELGFELCGGSSEGIELLATFPNLKKVSFEQVMSQKQISRLEVLLPNVELHIPYTEDSEAALRAESSSETVKTD